MLRNSRYATIHTKANAAIMAMPRYKFLFYACFNPGPALGAVKDFVTWQRGFAFQITRVDRPKATISVKELNQYNRKRLVQTGIEYDNINITFHDTVDDRVLKIWRDYYRWYFGDGRPKNAPTYWKSSVIGAQFPLGNGWGFTPPNSNYYDTNFFDSMDVYTFYGKKYTQVRFYNPKITTMTFDGLDTAQSEFAQADMTIKHEGFEYMAVSQPLTGKLITQFDLNSGDYYDVQVPYSGTNMFLSDVGDNLESGINSLVDSVSRNLPFVNQSAGLFGQSQVFGSSQQGVPQQVPAVVEKESSVLSRYGDYSSYNGEYAP